MQHWFLYFIFLKKNCQLVLYLKIFCKEKYNERSKSFTKLEPTKRKSYTFSNILKSKCFVFNNFGTSVYLVSSSITSSKQEPYFNTTKSAELCDAWWQWRWITIHHPLVLMFSNKKIKYGEGKCQCIIFWYTEWHKKLKTSFGYSFFLFIEISFIYMQEMKMVPFFKFH